MKETFELINQIINTISKTITIKSVVVNPDNTIDLQVNKTLWLTVSNRPITINGVDYKIVSITNNLLIKLFQNPTIPTVGTFEAYDFYFWHGTVIEVNNELNKIKASADKFPMCYLVEVLEEQNNYSELSPIGRSVNTRLLFAVETDYTNKDTQGLYSSGIDPTRNFVNEFINAVDSSDLVISFDDNYTTIPLTRIARYDANGHRTKVINSELTGLELRINIDFAKACDCCEISTDTVGLSGNNNIFLTCGTLSECQTIIDIETELEDHEERIEALEQGGGGGGLTCETISGCQTIIDLQTNKVDKEAGKGLSTNDFTDALKSNYDTAYSQTHTHANKSILDDIQEALTTALKTAYDVAVSWISTNGTNILNHISNTSNPHSVTKTQIGLSNVDNTSDANKPISTAQNTAFTKQRFNIYARTLSFAPADNTNYYVGVLGTGVNTTLDNQIEIQIPVACTLREISNTNRVSGLGSGENVNIKVVVNGVESAVLGTIKLDTNSITNKFLISGLNIAIPQNALYQIKMECPAFATNPTGVVNTFNSFFEPSI